MTTASVDVILVVGKNKIPVTVSTHQQGGVNDESLTVRHLCETIQQHTKIAPSAQKIIFRGRTLFKTFKPDDPSLKKSLSSLGIKNGDRIMVFGKPSVDEKEVEGKDPKLDELMKVLDSHQTKIEEICLLCRDMVENIRDNPGTLEDWKKQRKFFLCQSEYSMQELTRLDATPGNISHHGDYKARRKALVNRLLENVTMCDNNVSRLDASIREAEDKGKSS